MKAGKPYDFSSDVWQLGQLAYQLMSQPEADPDEVRALTEGGRESDHQWLRWVPDPVKSVIYSMVKQDPAERPTISQVLSHPWFNDNAQ